MTANQTSSPVANCSQLLYHIPNFMSIFAGNRKYFQVFAGQGIHLFYIKCFVYLFSLFCMWKSCLCFQNENSQLHLQRVKKSQFPNCSVSSDVLNRIGFQNGLCYCSWFSGREMLKPLYTLSVLIKNPDFNAEGKEAIINIALL